MEAIINLQMNWKGLTAANAPSAVALCVLRGTSVKCRGTDKGGRLEALGIPMNCSV